MDQLENLAGLGPAPGKGLSFSCLKSLCPCTIQFHSTEDVEVRIRVVSWSSLINSGLNNRLDHHKKYISLHSKKYYKIPYHSLAITVNNGFHLECSIILSKCDKNAANQTKLQVRILFSK